MNTALLLLRVMLGVTLLCHGLQKSLGWIQGPGLAKSALFFDSLGHRPGHVMVRVAAVCEVLSALSLLTGFLTPFGAAAAAGTLLVAGLSQVASVRAFWNTMGGGEYPLVLAGIAITLGFSGPGAWSLDNALFDPWPDGTGLAVLGLAVAASAPPALRSLRYLSRQHAGAAN